MPCPTCGHTLERLTGIPGHSYYLCPRCGTVSEQAVDEDANQLPGFPKVYVPKLVDRCRDLLAACRMVLDDPGLTASANDVIRAAVRKATA